MHACIHIWKSGRLQQDSRNLDVTGTGYGQCNRGLSFSLSLRLCVLGILNRATGRITEPSGKSSFRMKKRNDEGKTPRVYARFSVCAPNIILESYPPGWSCGVTTIKCRPVRHASLSRHYEFIHSRMRANASVYVYTVRPPENATDWSTRGINHEADLQLKLFPRHDRPHPR